MANYMIYLLSLLLLVVLVQGQGDIGLVIIGTSRGTIAAIPTAKGNEYLLREITPDMDVPNAQGVFTASRDDPFINLGAGDSNLVWDITGAKYTAGTPIGIYTFNGGANQKWTMTAGYNKIVSEHSPNMVANVSANGYLTLAPATSVPAQSAYQRMYILQEDEDFFIAEIFNVFNITVYLQATSPIGPWNLTVNASSSQEIDQLMCTGTVITFTNAAGMEVAPPFSVTENNSLIRIPAINVEIPDNTTTHWSGHYQVNSTSTAVNSISISAITSIYGGWATVTGNGTDSVYGPFNISGYYAWQGQVAITYSYATFAGNFTGLFNAPCCMYFSRPTR